MIAKPLPIGRYFCLWGLILAFCPVLLGSRDFLHAQEIRGQWVEGYKNRVRIFSGAIKGQSLAQVLAFIEIEMDKGWKTYWRNPGTAGGIAPGFDFSKSANISSLDVLYPVPELIREAAGDIIGYEKHVTFPVRITPEKRDESVDMNLTANFGICQKLCVPVEVTLTLLIPPDAPSLPSIEAEAAMAAVPHMGESLQPGDPTGLSVDQRLSDDPPRLLLSARFPGSAESAVMFVDVEGGLYIPIPQQRKVEGEIVTFELDLSDPEILNSLQGSNVRVTLKGQHGQSEQSFRID